MLHGFLISLVVHPDNIQKVLTGILSLQYMKTSMLLFNQHYYVTKINFSISFKIEAFLQK